MQMLSLICSNCPTPYEAKQALKAAEHSNKNMELHVLGSSARAARAAQLGVGLSARPPPASGGTPASSGTPGAPDMGSICALHKLAHIIFWGCPVY